MDYDAVVELAKRNIRSAIVVVQRQMQQAEEGVTELLYAEAAVAVVYAWQLVYDDALWNECKSFSVWGGRALDRADVLLIAFKVVHNAYTGLRYERVRFHAKALREAFRTEIPPEDLKSYISTHRGFKMLHDMEIARERGSVPGTGSLSGNGMPSSPETEDTAKAFPPNAGVARLPKRGGAWIEPARESKLKKQDRSVRYPDGLGNMKEVGVLVESELFSRLMTIESGRIYLAVEGCQNGSSKFVRLEAEEVRGTPSMRMRRR